MGIRSIFWRTRRPKTLLRALQQQQMTMTMRAMGLPSSETLSAPMMVTPSRQTKMPPRERREVFSLKIR